jgi:hypothetical protein
VRSNACGDAARRPRGADARIADAARLAQDGDTVEILSGDYRGDVAHARPLAPDAEFHLPVGTRPIERLKAWTPGAFETTHPRQ